MISEESIRFCEGRGERKKMEIEAERGFLEGGVMWSWSEVGVFSFCHFLFLFDYP